MVVLLRTETQYYFDVTERRWWILGRCHNDWKSLSNEEAHRLGLFKAVTTQPCHFIDTDIDQYNEAVSNIITQLENHSITREPSTCTLKCKSGEVLPTEFSSSIADNTEPVDPISPGKLTERSRHSTSSNYGLDHTYDGKNGNILSAAGSSSFTATGCHSREFDGEFPACDTNSGDNTLPGRTDSCQDRAKTQDAGRAEDGERTATMGTPSNSDDTNYTLPESSSGNIQNQIDSLIASTSDMKRNYRTQRELSKSNEEKRPTLRSTVRRLTYANNGGLAGCLKTVAEEREKMSKMKISPTPIQTKNVQLQKMMQHARSMAAKTLDNEEKGGKQNANLTKFGTSNYNDLKLAQGVRDVKFELSSESSDSSADERVKGSDQGMEHILAQRLSVRRKTAVITNDD